MGICGQLGQQTDLRKDVDDHPADKHKLALENEDEGLASVGLRGERTCKPYTAAIIAREMIGIAALPVETMMIR